MAIAVLPGSFDPPTLGHLDLVRRSLSIFDEVVIAIGVNSAKKPLFTMAQRIQLLQQALRTELADAANRVRIESTDQLLAEFARTVKAQAIVRGVRTVAEYEAEMTMSLLNRQLTGIETVLLIANPSLSYVSSSAVKEIAAFGGSLTGLVPPVVAQAMAGSRG